MCASLAEHVSQRSETAERILLAAADLFAERGYEAVSMNDIARQAGVSKANVFHHHTSKNDLYLAVVRRACTHSRERLTGLGSPQGALSERFHTFARGMLGDMLEFFDYYLIGFALPLFTHTECANYIRNCGYRVSTPFSKTL